MIEETLNRLAAAIEAQTAAMKEHTAVLAENQRLFAEIRGSKTPVTQYGVAVTEAQPQDAPEPEKPAPRRTRRTETVAEQRVEVETTVEVTAVPAPAVEAQPEPETAKREQGAVSKKDLTDLALRLARKDSSNKALIKSTLALFKAGTITELDDDKVGEVYRILSAGE